MITGFILGVIATASIAFVMLRRSENLRISQIKDIYFGYGAPDENGYVGYYRDNRHGSPFIHGNWGEQ